MDWQDELRSLDSKLAKEEVSQAEYRKLRDQVLAEASSGGPLRRPATPEPHELTPIPSSAADEGPSGEMTQVISAEEATQEQATHAEQQVPVQTVTKPSDADATMVLGRQKTSLASAFQPPARTPAPPPLPWETTHSRPAPPVQGNEVFSRARTESSAKRAVLGSLVVLVVLALIGGGVWFFLLRDDPSPTEAGAPNQPVQTAPMPAPDDIEAKLPDLAGVADEDNSTMSLDKAESLHILFGGLKDLYADAGANEIVVHAFSDANGASAVFVVPVPDKAEVSTVTQRVHDELTKAGYADATSPLPDGIRVLQRADKQNRYLYATYSSGGYNVQISVLQPAAADPAALTERLRTVAAAIAGVLPVG